MSEKYWLMRSPGFGRECEFVKDVGSQAAHSERHGDFDIDYLEVKFADGTTDVVSDGEIVPAGDWAYAAIHYRNQRHQDINEAVFDLLMQAKSFGITAAKVAVEMKLDYQFARQMLARLWQKGYAAQDADSLWFPGNVLVEKRANLHKP